MWNARTAVILKSRQRPLLLSRASVQDETMMAMSLVPRVDRNRGRSRDLSLNRRQGRSRVQNPGSKDPNPDLNPDPSRVLRQDQSHALSLDRSQGQNLDLNLDLNLDQSRDRNRVLSLVPNLLLLLQSPGPNRAGRNPDLNLRRSARNDRLRRRLRASARARLSDPLGATTDERCAPLVSARAPNLRCDRKEER